MKSFRQGVVSPQEYIELSKAKAIKSARIIPPRIGEDGFGQIAVVYRKPQYKLPDEW